MSGTRYINCVNSNLTLQEILMSLLVKDADGDYGLRVIRDEMAAADVSDGIGCTLPMMGLEDIIRRTVILDAAGKPALRLIDVSP